MKTPIAIIASAVAALLLTGSAAGPALAYDDRPNHVDWSKVESGECLVAKNVWGFKACLKGDKNGYWNVGFIGDSHMRQYFAPLDILAKRYHWRVIYISKSACTVGDWATNPIGKKRPSCGSWNRHLQKYLRTHPAFDLIVNSNSSLVSHGNKTQAKAYRTLVQSQLKRGTSWLVIKDNPKPDSNFLQCIAAAKAKAQSLCRRPLSEALLPPDILPAAISDLPRVHIADFQRYICPKGSCPAVIHGVQVYRDFSHLSKGFSQQLFKHVDAAIPNVFKHRPKRNSPFKAANFKKLKN
ncbi:MAG: SGNH hydrolase domain-containing protein [Micrococcales bacterium]